MSRSADAAKSIAPGAERFAARYELHELLGRGGMASVFRATDRVLGRQVALKQLTLDPQAPERTHVSALFEREFHTLVQLRHPRVIEVYDYGVTSDGNPFYTMELLDGGDLRERAPIDWRELCQLAFDVCSALALLHSRRLLHRDISPRNVRRTQAGDAKLIDFGALAPMGAGGADVVGTPAFTAPEVLQRLALDARTDLYSLGVTLYYALTARLPYAARTFSDLLGAWANKPVPPSALVAEIPPALDDLVLALVNVEPALRPPSAFEVMQRLAACAGLHVEETEAVSRAYLATPTLIGRETELAALREQLRDSRLRRAAGVLMLGGPGAGRSRLLDACALEAQTHGFTVLRATASGTRDPFATAARLLNHLLDSLPLGAWIAEFSELFASEAAANDNRRLVLRDLTQLEAARAQKLLRRLLRSVSRTYPLLIAVDDVHKIDEPSAALLAELIDKTRQGGMLIALTADSGETDNEALRALARRCSALEVRPLTTAQTRELLGSLFGAVPHLDMLSYEIHEVALGNPRQTLELAQHLVDHGLVRYTSGHWTLPSKLSADDLPRSAAAAMQTRIARLSQYARFLAEAQALAYEDAFSDADYRALLPAASARDVDAALSELLEAQAVLNDGSLYRLASRVWKSAFLAELDAANTVLRHRALAELYAAKQSPGFIHHAFAGDLDERGLEALDRRSEIPRTDADVRKLLQQHDIGKMVWVYPRAIETAMRLGRGQHAIHDLRRWQFLASTVSRQPADAESARLWCEQLSHDAGLDLYRSDTSSATPLERLTKALQGAHARYLATPEPERVYSVEQAIRHLGEYVVVAIVQSVRAQDCELARILPDLLEPYTPLSPLLQAIWLNVCGTRESHCEGRHERARDLWYETLKVLGPLSGTEDPFVGPMCNAIEFAIGAAEAQLGLASAAHWAERLESDDFQRITALELRKIVRLEQGDAEEAERLGRQAEVLSLQQRIPQMFRSTLALEIFAYAKSQDLAGLTQTIEQLKPLVARYPLWRPVLLYAEGNFQLVRGDAEAARAKFQACIELTRPEADGRSPHFGMWCASEAGVAEALFALGRLAEARAGAAAALAICEARSVGVSSFDLVRALALAEAKLGDTAAAAARLEALIAQQTAVGATGLRIGLSYEIRALVAIWSGDAAAFERFSELTAREYRHGARTPLGARYERLMNEAARSGMHAKLSLEDFAALAAADESTVDRDELLTMVTRSLSGNRSSDERTQIALQMICAAHGARSGHLFLLTPAGPVLRASQGAAAPTAELAHTVSGYVADKQQQAEELDDMATGLLSEDSVLSAVVRVAGGSYELLPLSCVVDASSTLAGIAAIEVGEARARNDKQAQLLTALAASLLQSGDSHGLRF
ncbi:MAG TPA: protein kinase [Polyangiales bacterium]|nr:protein kinase [Polyangiales bacterium]